MGAVAEEAGVDAEQAFGGDFVGGGLGVGDVVDDAGVDGVHSCGVCVADEGDLDGGGAHGEDGEFVSREVAVEIDEDVDLCVADCLGHVGELESEEVVPGVGLVFEALGEVVLGV